jgi:hypothetical protein
MRPEITEFSYGYAITDELVNWYGTNLSAAPFFPSLYKEGQKGGGFDLKLDWPGIPLFLQFKLSHCMIRGTAAEVKKGLFETPFYRMFIRPASESKQHQMLIDLESNGNDVYYVAPLFHKQYELNSEYLTNNVCYRSIWFKPSNIQITDNKSHHIAFKNHRDKIYLCSEPIEIKNESNFEFFNKFMNESFHLKCDYALKEDSLRKYLEIITNIIESYLEDTGEILDSLREKLHNKHPLEQIAIYSYIFFNCQLFIVHTKR